MQSRADIRDRRSYVIFSLHSAEREKQRVFKSAYKWYAFRFPQQNSFSSFFFKNNASQYLNIN